MAYTDWNTGKSVSSSGAKQQYGFICMATTVDDLSYTPSEQEKSRDAAQIEATGRRSWKTIKGRGEAVWPPILEAALIEALEKYQPDVVGAKSSKSLGRFPMRNRFISDYIFETTGKRRTPKQVGSRLQQLRDTCKEDRILHLISHHNTPDLHYTSSPSEGSVGASLSPSPEIRDASLKSVTVHVNICLQKELWPAPIPSIHFISNDATNPQCIQLSPSACTPHGLLGQSSKASTPSFLRLLSGSVEFPSTCALILQTRFIVYHEGSEAPVHDEYAPLRCVSSPMHRSGWRYTSDIVPGYWDNIISSDNVNRFSIRQILHPLSSSNSPSANIVDDGNHGGRTISIYYKFAMPEITRCRENVSCIAHSTPHSITLPNPLSAPAIRLPTSGLSYCQWQQDLQTSEISDVDPARYHTTSNTRGDLSSLSSTNTLLESAASFVPHQTPSNYVSLSSNGSTKYQSIDDYEVFPASSFYVPQHNSWSAAEQVTTQSFQSQHWETNYC